MRKIAVIFIALSLIFATYYTATGFIKRNDVLVWDYKAWSDDADDYVTIHCAVPTSIGYIRKMEIDGGGAKSYYLSFYSTFGGINSSIGAEQYFTLNVNDETEIYFSRPGGGYELVLERNSETGEWQRP